MRLLLLAAPAALLLSLVACGEDPQPEPLLDEARLQALSRDAAVVEAGRRLFETGKGYCTTCHGVGGAGTPQAPDLRTGRWKHGGRLADIQRVIAEGAPGTAMAGWRRSFSNDELAALAVYVRSLPPPGAPVTP